MTIARRKSPSQKKVRPFRPNLLFERLMALLAALNYLLVLFDLTYIPLRDFWLLGRVQLFIKIGNYEQNIPEEPIILPLPPITNWYDWVKGIEPNADTQRYLDTVDALEEEVIGRQLDSPQVARILEDLRRQSSEIIATNPFQASEKTGTFEKIKNEMREHIFENRQTSPQDAFQEFWSLDNFEDRGYRQELAFFNREIRPLIVTNYYRPIGENGDLVDNFGLLDLPFSLLFLIEFLARSWFISRRRTGVSWIDAMLWRWYDIFLFIPILRWLRILPVTVRLHQSRLLDMKAIQKQASQGFVASIAEDVTEVVVVNILNQVQGSIQRGEFADIFSQATAKPYIDLNDVNETAEITKLLLNVVINDVMPEIRPDVEALLTYSIDKAIAESPVYQGVRALPGMDNFKKQLTQQLTSGLYGGVYSALQTLIREDPEFDKLLEALFEHLSQSFGSELQTQQSLERLEYLLTALIEEVKVNYVQRLSEEDMESILDQTRALRQANL
ncbi:MAG: hypothetical protein SAJ12_14570 [Jaaginema sp. PMC 1079.18]|nr:hypothetical protein [Jaaginema sp. PMC 1080.18]MEC4852208.1 hypothetical protein [Jaaginema sp. PMC 1079.18]MEC4864502.1 hypothetical protein [Jaaginema sp. PMC 1078.18]